MDKPKHEADAPAPEEPSDVEAVEIERTRQLILQRRNRFIAAALAGIGTAVGSTACSDTHQRDSALIGSAGTKAPPIAGKPSACLSILPTLDAGAQPDAGPAPAGRPSVCLSTPAIPPNPPLAGSTAAGSGGRAGNAGNAGSAGNDDADAGPIKPPPRVCLSAPFEPKDAGK